MSAIVLLVLGLAAMAAGYFLIWPLFGTTNQLLAGLTLLVITVMLVRLRRPMWYTLVPLCFLLVMTIAALLIQLRTFFEQGNYFLLVVDIVVLIAAIMVAMECASALKRSRAEMAEQGDI